MADNIPGLPNDNPVARPYANSQAFGIGGSTVAELGAQTERTAEDSANFEGYLQRAQRQLNAKQAQIAFDRQKTQVYADLQTATTPEQAQAIYEHSKGQLDSTLQPFQGNKVLARQLGLFRQQEDVEILGTVNAKKAEIITHADKAANQVIGEKAVQQGIADTMAGGSAEIAREQYSLQLQSSVVHGTYTQQEADAHMQQWDKDVQTGVALTYINNPDPAMRQKAIAQLGGGSGPMDLSALDKGEIGRLYVHAVDTNHNLSYKEEAEQVNHALNVAHDAFSTSQYQGNFDLQKKALDDSQWLKEHGLVTASGEPDRVLASKVMHQVDANEVDYYQAATKKANEYRDQAFDMFSNGNISGGLDFARQHIEDFRRAKTDYWPQIVNASKSWMVEQRSEQRANHEMHNQDLQLQRQREQEDSFETLGNLQLQIMQGKRFSDTDIYGMVGQGKGKLLASHASEALRMSHSFENDPTNKEFYKSIASSGLADPAVLGELNTEFGDYLRKNPNANPTDKAAMVKQLTDQKHIEQINSGIDKVVDQLNGGTGQRKNWFQRLMTFDETPAEATDQGAPNETGPTQDKPEPTVVETRTAKDGTKLWKMSDGTIREAH